MRKILLLICSMNISFTFATPADEALIATAVTQGTTVYSTCIVTPPVTPMQQAACLQLYTVYNETLTAINAPLPLVPSIDPDPYAWSPYDICRFEAGHIVFGNQLTIPYCPTV